MRRTLTAEEYQDYHGVTFLGYPRMMFTKLLILPLQGSLWFLRATRSSRAECLSRAVVAHVAPKLASLLVSAPKSVPQSKV